MRIFILGLDGLEYYFVKPRNYPMLKQKEYGKIILPREVLDWFDEFGFWNPYTPTIWVSFLTGRLPKEHGITRERIKNSIWNKKFLNKARQYHFLKWLVHKVPKWEKIFSLLGFRKVKPKILVPTIFNYARKPIHVQVPVVDPKWEHKAPLGLRKKSVREIIEYLERRFMKIRETTLKLLDSNDEWDLFMAYASILDWAGHAYWGIDKKMEKYYNMAEKFAWDIKKRLDENTWMLIVSDHGMMPAKDGPGGMHSYHAFWSSNRPLGKKNIGLLEFFPMIVKCLKGGVYP